MNAVKIPDESTRFDTHAQAVMTIKELEIFKKRVKTSPKPDFSFSRSLPRIGVAITQRCSRSAQPKEGVEITEPEQDGEAVEDDGSRP